MPTMFSASTAPRSLRRRSRPSPRRRTGARSSRRARRASRPGDRVDRGRAPWLGSAQVSRANRIAASSVPSLPGIRSHSRPHATARPPTAHNRPPPWRSWGSPVLDVEADQGRSRGRRPRPQRSRAAWESVTVTIRTTAAASRAGGSASSTVWLGARPPPSV